MVTNPHGTKPLKQAGCESPCDYNVRSREDEEIVRAFVSHVRDYHQMDLPRGQALGAIKPVVA